MRRLLLLRHAKAEQPSAGMNDSERPLASRGRRDAGLVGAKIEADDLLPDLVLCSPAERTRETLAALGASIDEVATVFPDELYEPPSGDYVEAIRDHGGDAHSLLVVGHNPAIQRTALMLIGKGKRQLAGEVAEKYPTCALAVIEFEHRKWSRLAPRSGQLKAFIKPRSLLSPGEDDFDD
jgi:phosphohistidine phosphatase